MNAPLTPISTPGQHAAVQDEVQKVMSAVVERIHYAEGRRSNFSVIAGGLIAGGIALLTFALGNVDSSTAKFCIEFTSVALLAVGATIVFIYARQTNRYPWTTATTTWKWFYRDALPNQKEFDLGWGSYLWFGRAGKRVKQAFSAQLMPFMGSLARLSDPTLSLEQDEQQLYVLHVNEKFKNMHLANLRTATNIGLICILLSSASGAIYGRHLDTAEKQLKQIHAFHGAMEVNGRWHVLPRVGESKVSDVILGVTISNSAKSTLTLPQWTPYDEYGIQIPFDTESTTLGAVDTIGPQTSMKYTLLFQISAAAAKSDIAFKPEFR